MSEIQTLEDMMRARDPKELVEAGKRQHEMNNELYPQHVPNNTNVITIENAIERDKGISSISSRVDKLIEKEAETKRLSSNFPENKQIVIEPLSPEKLQEAKDKGLKDVFEYAGNGLGKDIKSNTIIQPILDLSKVYYAAKQIEQHNEGKISLSDKEAYSYASTVGIYLRSIEREQARGRTWGAAIASGVAAAPITIVEFIYTGGMVTAGKESLKKLLTSGAKSAVKKAVKKSIIKRAVTGTANLTARSLAQTALMPHRVLEKYMQDHLDKNIYLTKNGYEFMKESQQKPVSAFWKAVGNTWIDNFGEGAGGGLAIVAKGVGGKAANVLLSEKMRQSLSALFLKMKPGARVSDLMTKAGFNGFIGELSEEQLGTLMKAVIGTEDFGAGEDGTVMERVFASIPSKEDFFIQMGIIGVTGAGLRLAGPVSNSRKAEMQYRQATETQIDHVAGLKESVKKTVEGETGEQLSDAQVDVVTEKIMSAAQEGVELSDKAIQEIVTESMANDVIETPDAVKDLKISKEQKELEGVQEKLKDLEQSMAVDKEALSIAKKSGDAKAQTKAEKKLEQTTKDRVALEKVAEKAEKAVLTGRIDEMSKNADTALREVTQLVKQRDTLEEAGRPTKAVENKIESKLSKIDEMDAELGILMDQDTTAKVSQNSKIRVTARKLRDIGKTALSKGLAIGTKQARDLTKEEISKVQKELTAVIKAADVLKNHRADLLLRVKDIQTEAQLKTALRKLQDDIIKIQETTRSRVARSKIKDILKKKRQARSGGRPKGKLSLDVQHILSIYDRAIKATTQEADDLIANNIAAMQEDISAEDSIEMRMENHLFSTLSDLKKQSADSLEQSLQELKQMIRDDKSKAAEDMEAARDRRGNLQKTALRVIQGDKPTDRTDKPRSPMDTKAIQILRTMGNTMASYDGILNMLSQHDKSSKSFESDLNKIAEVAENEKQYDKNIRIQSEKIVKIFKDAFELKEDTVFSSPLHQKIRQDTKVEDLDVHSDAAGGKVRLLLSKSQARSLWMQMQDPSIREDLVNPKKGLVVNTVPIDGLSESMIEAIETFLTKQDIEVAQGLLDFYTEYYHRFNDQYRKDYKADLPQIENYSPVSRQIGEGKDPQSLLEERGHGRSTTPSSSKTRTKNVKKLLIKSDIEVVQGHILEVEQYLNWSDKVKDLDTIFGSSVIRNVIDKKFGENTNRIIDGFVRDLSKRGENNKSISESYFSVLRKNFSVSVIAFKEAIMFKQLVSFMAGAENIPITSFLSGVSDFAANGKNAVEILSKSDVMIDRKHNYTRDLKDATNNKNLSMFVASPTWKNFLLSMGKFGDRGAIYLGGWPVYRHTLNETGSKEKAMEAFEKFVLSSQQSGATSRQSEWQRGSEFQKLFTMFKSTPLQYLEKEVNAIRDGLQGRITPQEAFKKFVLYHFVLPMLFQWVSDGFEWDEEEQKRAAKLGSLNAIPIAGDITDYMMRKIINLSDDREIKQYGTNSPFFYGLTKGVEDAMKTISDDGLTLESVLESIKELASGTLGALTGQPIKTVINKIEGVSDIIEGDTETGVLKALGFPKSVAEKKKKKPTHR